MHEGVGPIILQIFIHTSTNSRKGIQHKNIAFWNIVALRYNCHKPKGGAYCPSRLLETKWGDISLVVVVKFTSCYWAINDLEEIRKTKDNIVLDATNLCKKNVGRPLIF